MEKKGQIFSLDIMVAAGVFTMTILGLVIFIVFTAEDDKIEDLQSEAEQMLRTINSDQERNSDPVLEKVTFVERGEVNITELQQLGILLFEEYEETKRLLGSKYDFCIYLEDDNGVIPIFHPARQELQYGLGSNEIQIGGKECNTMYTLP